MDRFIGTVALTMLGGVLGCFAEPAELSDGETEGAETGNEVDASSSSATSSTANVTSGSTTVDGPTATTSSDVTSGSTSSGPDSDAGTVGSTTESPSTSSGGIESACGVPRTTCVQGDFFCESFEEFQWMPLPMAWTPVTGGMGPIGPTPADAYCGDEALEISVDPGAPHRVLGASVPGLDLAVAHRFGGAIRVDAACLTDSDVRVMVLQYRSGGSEMHTVELWAEPTQISIRQAGLVAAIDAVPLPTGEWVDVSIAVTPGGSIQATVGDATLSTADVPAASVFQGLDGQLLVGPLAAGMFETRCVESFDDLFVRGTP